MHIETAILYTPLLLICLALVWGFGRIIQLQVQQGVSVLAFKAQRKTPAEIMLVLIAIVFDGYLIIRPFWPEADTIAAYFPVSLTVNILGTFLMLAGLSLAILSQVTMGTSWKIGVPRGKEDKQTLITTGLYAFSRNPIYVGIMIFLLGGSLIAPSALTAICLFSTFFLVQKVITREEAYMHSMFGKQYKAYTQKVLRWL